MFLFSNFFSFLIWLRRGLERGLGEGLGRSGEAWFSMLPKPVEKAHLKFEQKVCVYFLAPISWCIIRPEMPEQLGHMDCFMLPCGTHGLRRF